MRFVLRLLNRDNATTHRRCARRSPNPTNRMEMKMTKLIKSLKKDESGAALIEYALICGMLLAVVVTVMSTIGGNVNTILGTVQTAAANAAK